MRFGVGSIVEPLTVHLGPRSVRPLHGERALEHVEADHLAGASLDRDPCSHLGQSFQRIAILLMFVGQSAHQSATGAREPIRTEEELLLERELQWDRPELVKERPAAQGPTAGADLP